MSALGAIALLAAQASQPAMTVNDIELGPAEKFTTHGPATVCMKELVIRPEEGQSVQLAYSGIHHGSLLFNVSPTETIELNLGNNWRDFRKAGQRPLWRGNRMEFYPITGFGDDGKFQIEGYGIKDKYDSAPRILVEGAFLKRKRADKKYFKRVSFQRPDKVTCDRRYDFGWGVLLDGDPLDVRTEAQTQTEDD